jgi:transcriptional regulator GlxA family with amidase domain
MTGLAMHTVAVLAYEGVIPFHLSIPCIVFGDDLLKLGAPRYRLLICGENTGLIPTISGFQIGVQHGLEALAQADTVIVPAWRDPIDPPSDILLDALRGAHARGARIVGLCLGTFVLARAGLLEGRTASTHWAWADEFERAYPDVTLDRNALYVDDGDILTSAGTAAAIDCCLHLVRPRPRRRDRQPHRPAVGGRAAPPWRTGRNTSRAPCPPSATPISSPRRWNGRSHISTSHSAWNSWRGAPGMSLRSFTRRFKQKTGVTVVQWLLNHRLAEAQRRLETGDCSIEQIAEMAGFGSAVSLRQHFTRAFSISPASYRRQFRKNAA